MKEIYENLMDHINKLEIIDTHEHLPCKEELRVKQPDILAEYCGDYFGKDLISSGMPEEKLRIIVNDEIDILEKWDIVEPYWENCRNTGYGQCMDISVKGIYGVNKISRETISELNEKFLNTLKGGQYEKVLKKKSNIKISLLDNILNPEYYLDYDEKYFKCVNCLDNFIYPQNNSTIEKIEKNTGIKITSFQNWLYACEKTIDTSFKKGIDILKTRMAYIRSLYFKSTLYNEAEDEFNNIFFSKKHFT